jgi:hypothetical protein
MKHKTFGEVSTSAPRLTQSNNWVVDVVYEDGSKRTLLYATTTLPEPTGDVYPFKSLSFVNKWKLYYENHWTIEVPVAKGICTIEHQVFGYPVPEPSPLYWEV